MEKNHKTSQSSCCCCVLFSVRKREIIIAGLMVVLTCLSFDISTNYSLNYVFLTIYDLSPRLSLHLIPNRKSSLWQPSSVYYHCSVTPGCYPSSHGSFPTLGVERGFCSSLPNLLMLPKSEAPQRCRCFFGKRKQDSGGLHKYNIGHATGQQFHCTLVLSILGGPSLLSDVLWLPADWIYSGDYIIVRDGESVNLHPACL